VEQNDEGITVRATIANTGGRAGSETVQLYVRPEDPGVPRPVRELKAFSKIELAPGEKKRVGLKLSPAGLAYYDVVQKNWFAEPGGFTIELAASSRDIRLSKKIRWTKELRYQRPCDPSAVR
jgi:beta-glucosidase